MDCCFLEESAEKLLELLCAGKRQDRVRGFLEVAVSHAAPCSKVCLNW